MVETRCGPTSACLPSWSPHICPGSICWWRLQGLFCKSPTFECSHLHQKHPASKPRPCGLPPSFFPDSRWPSLDQYGRLGPRDKHPGPLYSCFKKRQWPVGSQGSHACPWPKKFSEGAGRRETRIEHLLYAWQVLQCERTDTKCLALGLAHFKGWKFLLSLSHFPF